MTDPNKPTDNVLKVDDDLVVACDPNFIRNQKGRMMKRDMDDLVSDASFLSMSEVDEISLRNKARDLAELLERCAKQLRYKAKVMERMEMKRSVRRQARLPTFVTDYLLLLTSVWQVLCVTILVFIDLFARKAEKGTNAYYVAGIIVMFVFQVTNLVVALAATVKLAKQYLHHTASTQFLIQSYLSTLVLFGGLYLLIYRMNASSFDNVFKPGKRSKVLVVELFMRMLFFSISTGTLCGGAPVVASVWYSEIVMSCQMMLSFVYFASVLSQFVNPSLTAAPEPSKKEKKDFVLSNSYGSTVNLHPEDCRDLSQDLGRGRSSYNR